MKTKQLILSTMAVAWGVFGATYSFASVADDQTYLNNHVRVTDVDLVAPGGVVGAGSQIHFDVTLTDVESLETPASPFANWKIDSVSLKSAGAPGDHPYLALNVPFEGDSVNANTGATLKTTEARAYFNGMYNKKVRFTYTVRPGDMVTKLQWKKTLDGNPEFHGWQALSVSFYRGGGVLAPTTIGMQPDTLKEAPNTNLIDKLDTVPVSGYTFEVGDRTGDEYDSNYDVLRGGLVPVTIAVPEGGRSPKGKCYVWAMNEDGSQYYPVAVTNMTSPDAIVKISPNTLTPAASFSEILGNTATLTTPVTSANPLRVMVNVPETADKENLRICFGRKPADLPTVEPQHYAYFNHLVEKETRVRNNFTVQGSDFIAQTDGKFTLETAIAAGLKDAGKDVDLQDTDKKVKEGGEVTVAVGGVVSLRITSDYQKFLTDTGTVYAALEQISQDDVAGVKPAVYAIPLTSKGFVLKIAGADAAPADPQNNMTEYRIRIPGLKDTESDRYYYLRVRSVPKQEIITINAAPDASTELRENFQNVTVVPEEPAQPAQKFVMNVEPEPDARRFLIHPITYNTEGKIVRITDEYVFVDPVTVDENTVKHLKVLDALARYVSVQQGSPSLSSNPRATLNIRVSAMATSAEFYFVGVNDDALNGIKGREIAKADAQGEPILGTKVTVSGIEFAAAACNGAGVITGENDDSSVVALNLQNRAPAVSVSTNPDGSYDSPHFFQVKVDDVSSDYLVVFGRFAGMPDKESFGIYANVNEMKLLFGEKGWEDQLTRIQNTYGAEFGFTDIVDLKRAIKDRALASEVLMRPTFVEGREPSWQVVAFDSSFTKTEVKGVLKLDQEQKILVTTVFPGTVDGRGYVLWGDQVPGGTFDSLGWIFGSSFTSSVIKSAGVSYVNAYPFAANTKGPAKYAEISRTRDSFFYCWRYDPKYVPALPDAANPHMPYQPALRVNSRFTLEDQKQQAGGKNSDILLSAYFVTEFHEGDAYTAFTKTASTRTNLLDLGDYDADGVPDGWVMANYNNREQAEGGTLGKTGAPNDVLPLAGQGGGDAAYRLGNSSGSLGLPQNKGPMTPGAAFTHKMRVRGFDDSLNAADGEGKWLSNPAWVVLVREFNDEGKAVIGTLTKKDGKLSLDPNAGWKQIRLNQSGVPAEGETFKIEFTAANRIPYYSDGTKNYAVGADGKPVKTANYSVTVDPTAETLTLEYSKGWVIDAGDTGATTGLTGDGVFPFADVSAESSGDLVIDGVTVGSFRSDANAVAGVLLDEPFVKPEITRNSWLNRIPVGANAADADGDGMTNGQEYFLWYYASRIAYAAVSEWTAASGKKMSQVHTALWPAIALPKDGKLVVNKGGTIGRAFNPAYDTANDMAEGNFWVPISAEAVMNAFNPQTPGQGGADLDGDGLSNVEELALGSNPIDCDTDGDGMIDGWEVKFGLNPLNAGDAFINEDGDAYATTLGSGFFERSDYHPLFKVTLAAPVTGETAMLDPIDRVILSVPDADLADIDSCGFIPEDKAKNYKRSALPTPVPDLADPKVVAGYLEMPAKPLAIRDHDVYLAFGFDPTTAVNAETRPAHNTQPFVAVEEFKSAVKLAAGAGFKEILRVSSDPTKADTNDDGVPDGWALYVGVRPYLDPNAGLEPGFLDPDADGLITAGEYWFAASDVPVVPGKLGELVAGWDNKGAPTDPGNSDTDADGIADGTEGMLFKYTARGEQESLGAPATVTMGRGMNPNALDTDGDGLSDGWEASHGLFTFGLAGVTAPAEGEADKNKEDRDGAADLKDDRAPAAVPADADHYTAYLREFFPYAVDPTNANDADIDPDRDGLSNAQEYYIGYLRHLRYDLAADASRLYERFPGKTEKDPISGEEKVVAVADAFNAVEDLAQPQAVPSPLFTLRGAALGNHGESGLIDPRSVGVAAGGTAAEGVLGAFRANWDRTVVYPTARQFAGYGAVLGTGTAAEAEKALVAAVEDLDAVVARRRPTVVNAAYDSPSFAGLFDAERMDRELRACICRVDACIRTLVASADGVSPVVADMLKADSGKTPIETVWAARRDQLLMTLPVMEDPAYGQVSDVLGLGTAVADPATYPDRTAYKPDTYEAAVRSLKNPIVKIQYRDAVRGMNGGLRVDELGRPYLTVIGWHESIKAFAERRKPAVGAVAPAVFFLGSDVTAADVVALHPCYTKPMMPVAAVAFPTTSPVALDSDLDGMDDHWEIFHGLNPILGDFISKTDEGFSEGTPSGIAYAVDRIGLTCALEPTVKNPFRNEAMDKGRVSDYNYVAYPWMAGAPFADPDGDGLTNAEEAVNPMGGDVPRYGTDPSPLWMTDPANPNSVVSRFYGSLSLAVSEEVAEVMPVALRTFFIGVSRTVPMRADPDAAVLPYEINEGFDTDGDGIDDRTELISESVLRGEPQSALSPSRQNVAYFEGKGAMQSHAAANFGPSALETFTVECWVNPAPNQFGEVVIVDRPWRYSEELVEDPTAAGQAAADLRHNFQIGFRAVSGSYEPFARYTGMGTTVSGSTIDYSPKGAPEVTVKGADALPANTWTHLAVTYDGEMLTFYVNGGQRSSIKSGLIPATGVISIKNDLTGVGGETSSVYTFRNAPILIGAAPSQKWLADFTKMDTDTAVTGFGDVFEKTFKGYVDEVRVWNGARTGNEILEAYQRTLTQPELLRFRYTAFMARALGDGLFQTDMPVEPYAIYTFDDLIASTKADETKPWERFPGASVAQTEPGTLLARRNGLRKALEGKDLSGKDLEDEELKDVLPKVDEVFTSYYGMKTPKLTGTDQLLSKHYFVEDATSGVITTYEIVPRAQNMIQHLPAMDVEAANFHLTSSVFGDTALGGWETPYHRNFGCSPSGNPENLKPVDTVYWTPYAAGREVEEKALYNVKVASNPYAYRHTASTALGADYRLMPAYTDIIPTDLMLYGDVYARYTTKSWDGSPSTDNSSGGTGGTGGGTKPGEDDWFEFNSSTGDADPANGTAWNETQMSNGQAWLDKNVGMGQTKDDDADRLPNWWESYYTLDPADPEGNNGAHGDPDGDCLTNFGEYLAGANPLKYATAGNGVPDFHIPVWMRRGRPTFGLLYSDNDFMEDVWEADHRSAVLSPDVNDGWEDADGDGWTNWSEARANFRTSRHSTDPSKKHGNSPLGTSTLELPTPAFRMTVDYFGDMNVYTNASANSQIVIHSYTAVNNNSAPDAVFTLPLAYSVGLNSPEDGGEEGNDNEEGEDKPTTTGSIAQDVGMWGNGEFSGYLHVGNLIPGSFSVVYTRKLPSRINKEGKPVGGGELSWRIESDTKQNGDSADLYYERTLYTADKNGKLAASGQVREPVGTINYATGYYTLSFPKSHPFWGDAKWYRKGVKKGGEAADGPTDAIEEDIVVYDGEDFAGTAYYSFRVMPGTSNTYTVVYPASGWMKEGPNNFFVFADLNGNGKWEENEPAGVPDQQNVEVGFDQINRPLHVTLSTIAPPGAVRVNIIDRITGDGTEGSEGGLGGMGGGMGDMEEGMGGMGGMFPGFGGGSIPNIGGGAGGSKPHLRYPNDLGLLAPPEAGQAIPERPIDENGRYDIAIVRRANIGLQGPSPTNPIIEFTREYNFQKPYITEDEIFSALPAGLPGSWDANQLKTEYMVCLLPKGAAINPDTKYQEYAVAVVTNHLTKLEQTVTELVSPLGGKEIGNSEINFDWSCNVQVPTFTLKIVKVEGITGEADGKTVFEKTIRGVTPFATDRGNGQILQYRYRYTLNRGVGEVFNGNLFGNGLYRYTLTLNPYNGSSVPMQGTFRLTMRDSITKTDDPMYDAKESAIGEVNSVDSYFVRARVRYNGVLCTEDDFAGRQIFIEAHYSASFNGDPVAATSDCIVYNDNPASADAAAVNPYVVTVRDLKKPAAGTAAFYSTRFDAELRGLATDRPVYLVAYLDLNGNRSRDAWEPWGYAAMGKDANSGFYYDPKAVKPTNRKGSAFAAEFYIQDVDTDNDHIADAWEWKANGRPGEPFSKWCETLTGSFGDQKGKAIWVGAAGGSGTLGLTAYGAQLLGFTVKQPVTVAPNGAVEVEETIPGDMKTVSDIMDTVGLDGARELFAQGYSLYGLSVKDVRFDGDTITLGWDVTAALQASDGTLVNVTDEFASRANGSAAYAVYGKAALDDTEWTLLESRPIRGVTEPEAKVNVSAAAAKLGDRMPAFFRVILSARAPAATTAE